MVDDWEVQTGFEIRKGIVGQSFCENICILIPERNMKDTDLISMDIFPDKVNVHINMFYALMLNQISRKIHLADIITIYNCCCLKWAMELEKRNA